MSFDPALTPEIVAAIREDAVARFPNESCGGITAAGYVPFENVSTTPTRAFDCWKQMAPLQADGSLLALVHSHPGGPFGPSAMDMTQQEAMALPWGITASSKEHASIPYFWGDMLPNPPLLKRQFRHGPSGSDGRGDCYALVRDWYLENKQIALVEGPRDDSWWTAETNNDLYMANFARAGFAHADASRPEVGDVVLFSIRAPVANHAGVYVGNGMIMHHLPNRYSREEPLGPWLKLRTAWLRHAN